jgi:acyl-CoA synthetase (AMP-forming)/AMP-acid ligase II
LETTLTYQELWNQTHQLAQRLQSITSLSKGDRYVVCHIYKDYGKGRKWNVRVMLLTTSSFALSLSLLSKMML